MKHFFYLFTASLLVVTFCGCSDGGKLTNQKAQQAVTQWLISIGDGAATATVTGVLEVPQESSAKADVNLSNFVWNSPKNDAITAYAFGPGGAAHTYAGRADAIFIHYNDGRWVLSKIVTPMGSWDNLNIIASGEGASPPSSATLPGSSKQSVIQDVKDSISMMTTSETATVGTNEALFSFSVDPIKVYNLCGFDTYVWAVEVDNSPYTFSYNSSGGRTGCEEKGSLQELMKHGKFSAWKKAGENQESIMPGVILGHDISPDGKTLVLKLSDANAISQIFANKPKQVVFKTIFLKEKYSRPVRVTYTSS